MDNLDGDKYSLKRCPFCGGGAEIIAETSGYAVRCKGCGAKIAGDVIRNVVRCWNSRWKYGQAQTKSNI